MKFKILSALAAVAATLTVACSTNSINDIDRSRQPHNRNSATNGNPSPTSIQDLLTATQSSDKVTRLNAIKGMEAALKSASQNDLMTIESRLAEMAQQDPDEDVRNAALWVLLSTSGDEGDEQNPPPSNNDSNSDNNDDSNSGGPLNGEFYGAVLKCVKSAEKTRYPNLPKKYEVACSPIMTGSNYQKLQEQLSQWQNTNCKSPLFTDESSAFTGTDGKTYVPHFVPSYPQLVSASKRSEVESSIQSGTCKAASGTHYGRWDPKASN